MDKLIIGLIAGGFGVGYMMYGKRQTKFVPLIAGILLCAYPYFVDGWLWLSITGVVLLAVLIAVIAVFDGAVGLAERWQSSRIGESLILDLRRAVFGHVQKMPVAFFTRTRTGAGAATATAGGAPADTSGLVTLTSGSTT